MHNDIQRNSQRGIDCADSLTTLPFPCFLTRDIADYCSVCAETISVNSRSQQLALTVMLLLPQHPERAGAGDPGKTLFPECVVAIRVSQQNLTRAVRSQRHDIFLALLVDHYRFAVLFPECRSESLGLADKQPELAEVRTKSIRQNWLQICLLHADIQFLFHICVNSASGCGINPMS